ncbi:MAG: flippase-like domain-containing protein [Anaerolineales bacterium]|nr:flippase-like domain-containing protein [Anaerolineales bacterium]
MSGERGKDLGRWVRLAGSLLSAALLVWLVMRQDWNALLTSLEGASIGGLLLAFGCSLVSQGFNAARWWTLLEGQQIRPGFYRVVQIAFAGLFASNFLPGTVGGDVARVAGILPYSENRIAGAASVIVDRVIGVFGMTFMLPFSLPLIRVLAADPDFFSRSGSALSGVLFGRILNPIKRLTTRSVDALKIWVHRPGSLILALLFSWGSVVFYLLVVWLVARELGIKVSYWQVAGATGISYFLTLLPISINGYGVRELVIFGVYSQLGADPEQATALALVTRVILVSVSLPGSLWLGGILKKKESSDEVLV